MKQNLVLSDSQGSSLFPFWMTHFLGCTACLRRTLLQANRLALFIHRPQFQSAQSWTKCKNEKAVCSSMGSQSEPLSLIDINWPPEGPSGWEPSTEGNWKGWAVVLECPLFTRDVAEPWGLGWPAYRQLWLGDGTLFSILAIELVAWHKNVSALIEQTFCD